MIQLPFEFSPSPGEVIRGDVRLGHGPPPRNAIVVVHGFKGFKDWAFFPHVCEELAAGGFAVVSFNFSRNGIGPDLENFTQLESFATNTFSREQEELALVIERVLEGDLLARRPDRLGLLGHSRGGACVIVQARDDSRVRCLGTWASVANLDRWTDETREEWRAEGRTHVLNGRTGQHMPLDVTLLEDFEENSERLDVQVAAGELEIPWLVVHGSDDVTVPDRDGHTLARLGRSARLVLIEGAGHTFEAKHPLGDPPTELGEALAATLDHFARHLGND